MTLVIDNYDSFTFNLVQLLGRMTVDILVRRNDQISVSEIRSLAPARILLSPGPGRPEDAGITVEVIKTFGETIPILGVCLGHQAIGLAFGGTIVHAPTLMHGKVSVIHHNWSPLFAGVSNPFRATRYHSLVVSDSTALPELEVTARSSDGVIMGLRHKRFPVEGVQFHPESILTDEGETILRNWLSVQV